MLPGHNAAPIGSEQPATCGWVLPLMVPGSWAAESKVGWAPQTKKQQHLMHLSLEEKVLQRETEKQTSSRLFEIRRKPS